MKITSGCLEIPYYQQFVESPLLFLKVPSYNTNHLEYQ
jgi:hypothetical protein